MQTIRPAGIYLRLSDDREGKRLGVQRQEADTTRLAEQLGIPLYRIYSDNDVTAAGASTKPRPDYAEMLADARSGQIKTIIAYSTSRLTRRPREHEDLIDLARLHQVAFHFVASPAFDLNTADGREMARVMAARDTGEVDRLTERIIRKKLESAESGQYPGGIRCYGIGSLVGVNPANGKEVRNWTELDAGEATILREISDRILEGDSQFAIVRDFKERGILTSRGFPWTVGKLKRSLLNESYVIFDPTDPEKRGTRIHHGNRHRAIWPGIFTRVEHDMMVNYFNNNPYSWQQGHVAPRSYLLSGFTYCGNCGGSMYGQGKSASKGYVRRYHCKKYNTRGEQVGCCKVFRIADAVEYLVSEAVLFRFDSPEVATALAPRADQARARELTEEVVMLQQRRQTLAVEHAITPYDDYGLMLSTIKAKQEAAQMALNRLRTEEAKAAMVPALGSLRERWETGDIKWRASVIRLLVEKVIIHPAGPSRTRWNGWHFDPTRIEVRWW
jgi:site-specific DNA recombinase